MHPLPPDCTRVYAPVRALATGGYGAVWEVEHRHLGRRAAVKVLHEGGDSTPDQLARFAQEARVTAQLSHPNVVVVLDYGAEHGVPWIAYEFLEGRTVGALAAAGPVPLALALSIGAQVARALACAHAAQVLHRDVKPDNVIEAAAGLFKVADFGVARWSAASEVRTATGVILGTPLYLAPEVIRGQTIGPAADLYALAVMLHELVAGAPPFTGENVYQVLEAHVRAPPPPLPQAPPALARLVARGLAKDPAARPASATEFADALEAIEAELGVRRTPAGLSVLRAAPRQATVQLDPADRTRAGVVPTMALTQRVTPPRAAAPALAAVALGLAAIVLAALHPTGGSTPRASATATPRADAPPARSTSLAEAHAAIAQAYAELATGSAPTRPVLARAAEACAHLAAGDRDRAWTWDRDRPGLAALAARALDRDPAAAHDIRDALCGDREPARESRAWFAAHATRKATVLAECIRAGTLKAQVYRAATELYGVLHGALRSDPRTEAEVVALVVAVQAGEPAGIAGVMHASHLRRFDAALMLAALIRLRQRGDTGGPTAALRELLERHRPPPPHAKLPDVVPAAQLVLPAAVAAELAAAPGPMAQPREWLHGLLAGVPSYVASGAIVHLSPAFRGIRDWARTRLGDTAGEETRSTMEAWLAAQEGALGSQGAYWYTRSWVTADGANSSPLRTAATLDFLLHALDVELGAALDGPPAPPGEVRGMHVHLIHDAALDAARRLDTSNVDLGAIQQLAEATTGISETERPPDVLLRNAMGACLCAAARAVPPIGSPPTSGWRYPPAFQAWELRLIARLAPNQLLDPRSVDDLRLLAQSTRIEPKDGSAECIRLGLESLNRKPARKN